MQWYYGKIYLNYIFLFNKKIKKYKKKFKKIKINKINKRKK